MTASQAVFVSNKDNKKKAAAAVVGYQFRHTALQELFTNITSQVNFMMTHLKNYAHF